MPASSARRISGRLPPRPATTGGCRGPGSPKLMQPRQMGDTSRPVRPSFRERMPASNTGSGRRPASRLTADGASCVSTSHIRLMDGTSDHDRTECGRAEARQAREEQRPRAPGRPVGRRPGARARRRRRPRRAAAGRRDADDEREGDRRGGNPDEPRARRGAGNRARARAAAGPPGDPRAGRRGAEEEALHARRRPPPGRCLAATASGLVTGLALAPLLFDQLRFGVATRAADAALSAARPGRPAASRGSGRAGSP